MMMYMHVYINYYLKGVLINVCCKTLTLHHLRWGLPCIDPGSLVFQWYANFRKTVWIIHIPTVLEGFAYPWKTRICRFCLGLWQTPS